MASSRLLIFFFAIIFVGLSQAYTEGSNFLWQTNNLVALSRSMKFAIYPISAPLDNDLNVTLVDFLQHHWRKVGRSATVSESRVTPGGNVGNMELVDIMAVEDLKEDLEGTMVGIMGDIMEDTTEDTTTDSHRST
jgi:hypothetical protein